MSIIYKIAGVTLTNRVRLLEEGEGFVTAAERGAIATGGVLIDDPDADLTIKGWQTFTVDDDEAFPYSRVFSGFIAERSLGRGGRFRAGASRVHDCAVLDVNAALHMRVLRTNAAKRGAETDVARVTWLLTSEGLATWVFDRGLVSSASPINFLEADTRRSFPDDVLGAIAPTAGKNFFAYYDNATSSYGLFYDADTAAVNSSSLRISNVASDVDNVITFAPSSDASLERQPNDLYTGVSYGWRGDPIYATSATTTAAYGIRRDAVYDTDRVGLAATAQTEALRYLNVHSTEADHLTVTLILPSARINDLYAGQRIQVKFQHLPGYTSFVWTRVRRRSVKPIAPQFWEVRLELWVPSTVGTDAAVPVAGIVQFKTTTMLTPPNLPSTITLDTAPSVGNLLVACFYQDSRVSATIWPADWTQQRDERVDPSGGAYLNSYIEVRTHPVVAGDTGVSITHATSLGSVGTLDVWEISGATVGSTAYAESVGTTITVPAITAATGLLLGLHARNTSAAPRNTPTGWTLQATDWEDLGARQLVASFTRSVAAGTYGPITFEGGAESGNTAGFVILELPSDMDAVPAPAAGAPVDADTATPATDGTTTLFTATYPYEAGTLAVKVDGIWLMASDVTETNPVAGTFTLAFAPEADETLETRYTAR